MISASFFIVLSYIMGSFCSAIVICRLFNLPDPRTTGSNNPGATNVLRIAGKKYAALVMLFDLLKGTIPVVLAKYFNQHDLIISYTVLAAVIGHMYPVFFHFKGGKGVATSIGALLGFQFIVGTMVSVTWLLVAKFSRYSSLASIVAITLAPFYALLIIQKTNILLPLFFMVILILFQHKDNIARLINGTESKITLKKNILHSMMNKSSHDKK